MVLPQPVFPGLQFSLFQIISKVIGIFYNFLVFLQLTLFGDVYRNPGKTPKDSWAGGQTGVGSVEVFGFTAF